MTPTGVLNILLGIAAVLGLVAGAVVYFRASLATNTIAILEKSNKALADRVLWLEGETARFSERIKSLEAENAMLRSIVTGVDELKRIATAINDHHAQRHAEHERIISSLDDLLRRAS